MHQADHSTDPFNSRFQQMYKPYSDLNLEPFPIVQQNQSLTPNSPKVGHRIPSCLASDHYVNLYFREWAPLFPVLDEASFFSVYADFVADFERVQDMHQIAHLYLVFSIANLSSVSTSLVHVSSYERQWTDAIEAVLNDNTIHTLQGLTLAILYCSIKPDLERLNRYKTLAVELCRQFLMYPNQNQQSCLGTSKRVFWTLYTLDT